MREVQRLPEPRILIERKELWLQRLLESGKARPDSSKYAHSSIKTQLNSMSSHKCFYCETKLKGKRKEVDHHIEVSVDIYLSYEWENLCLSCDNCNNKLDHNSIPIEEALNPCIDSDEEIMEHLTFDDEIIEARNNSEKGLKTIRKYRLDTELLDMRRLKSLKLFMKLLVNIQLNQIKEGRNGLTDYELNAINKFKRKDQSFSLMFEILLDKYGF